MSETTTAGMNWLQYLMVLLTGTGLVGMPPGERDAALVTVAPRDSIVYLEWAGRGPGKSGAPGIDGLAADPEIQAFRAALEKTLANPQGQDDEEQSSHQREREIYQLLAALTAQPGCLILWPSSIPSEPGQVPGLTELLARLNLAVVLKAGPETATILAQLGSLTDTQIPEHPTRFEWQLPFGIPLVIHEEGGHLLLCGRRDALDQALAGLGRKRPGLDANHRFTESLARVGGARLGSLAWIDVKSVVDFTLQGLGPAAPLVQVGIASTGLDAVSSLTAATTVHDGQVVQRVFLKTTRPLLGSQPPLRLASLSHIPADSQFVAAGSLDLERVLSDLRNLVGASNRFPLALFDESVKELESEIQLNLKNDIFGAIGNTWTVFSPASDLLGSELIVAVEIRDAVKARRLLERLMSQLEQSLVDSDEYAIQAELRQQTFLGQPIYYVCRTGQTFGVSAATIPSFSMTDRHLLFAMTPQTLRNFLKSPVRRGAGFDTTAAARLSLPDEPLLAAAFVDGQRLVRTVGAALPYLGQSIADLANGHGWTFDPYAIPSSSALAPYAGDLTVSVARRSDGVLIESRNPQIGLVLLTVMDYLRRAEYDIYVGQSGQDGGVEAAGGLGAPEGGVVPAAAAEAERKEPPRKEQPENAAAAAARRAVPILIRAAIPDGVQPLVPDDLIRRIVDPTPEEQQRRAERRESQERRRQERLERRTNPRP